MILFDDRTAPSFKRTHGWHNYTDIIETVV